MYGLISHPLVILRGHNSAPAGGMEASRTGGSGIQNWIPPYVTPIPRNLDRIIDRGRFRRFYCIIELVEVLDQMVHHDRMSLTLIYLYGIM